MAIKANLSIDQGTDFFAVIDVVDGAGRPYNLTGWTAASQMRKNYASQTAYDFVAEALGASGKITLSMSNSETNEIEPGRYLYDIEIISEQGTINRVVEGIVTVNPGITRVDSANTA